MNTIERQIHAAFSAERETDLAIPVIAPSCRLRVINEQTRRWDTLETLPYTPRHINDALKRHGMSWGFVAFAGGNEHWEYSKSGIAKQF